MKEIPPKPDTDSLSHEPSPTERVVGTIVIAVPVIIFGLMIYFAITG